MPPRKRREEGRHCYAWQKELCTKEDGTAGFCSGAPGESVGALTTVELCETEMEASIVFFSDPYGHFQLFLQLFYMWLLNSYVQEKAKGLLVAEDGSVPQPISVATVENPQAETPP